MSANSLPRRRLLAGLAAAPLAAGSLAASGGGHRSPDAAPAAAPKNASQGALLPPFEVRVLNRMGFGPARRRRKAMPPAPPGRVFAGGFEQLGDLGEDDVAYFLSLGRSDDERLAAWVEQQLDPALPDPDLAARMAQYPAAFALLSEPLATTFSTRECNGFNSYSVPLRVVERAAFTRAVYSRRQLFELMVDFWHNHLNVFGGADEDTYVSWASWDRDVIRAHAFGNFYQMLYASARHPAMLEYLDNYNNSKAGFNENYARELLELHTLGAEHYAGVGGPLSVPALAANPYTALADPELDDAAHAGGLAISDPSRQIAAMYVDNDVYEAARALTGWRYDDENTGNSCGTGAFYTSQADHDVGSKIFLARGQLTLSADQAAELEGRLVIKMVAWHPATATYIARKLCRRLIADDPPQSIVDAAAATFFEYRTAPDQIARTLRTILLSDEFKDPALWGRKTKRPFEVVASAMRAAGCQHTFRDDDSVTGDFLGYFRGTGQQLFWWRTPDGYPDRRAHWEGSTSLVQGWRTLDWLLDKDATSPSRVMRVIDITLENLAGNPTPRQLCEFWCEWILGFVPPGGSWVGPFGTPYQNAPTTLGSTALQFFTQQGFSGIPGGADATLWPADEIIPRAELSTDSFPNYWSRRLRGLVALVLWSPNFMQR